MNSKFDSRIYFFLIVASVSTLLISIVLLQVFMVLLSLLWLFEKGENKKKSIDQIGYLVILYGIVRILAIVFSEYQAESLQSLYKEALFYLGFFSMNFYFKLLGTEDINKIINSFIAAAAAVACIGIIKFNLDLVDRADSFSSGAMTFSIYLLTGLGMLIGTSNKMQHASISIVKSIAISFILTGIFVSLGRVSIAIGVLIILAGIITEKINIKIITAVVILTTFLSAVSFYNNTIGLFKYRVENPMYPSDRDILLKASMDLFLKFENPALGYGPLSFNKIFPYKNQIADKNIGSWHNDFVQIYFESGFLGLTAFLLLITVPLVKGYKFLSGKKQNSFDLKRIIWGVVISLSALILSAITSGFINSPILSLVFAFLIALQSGIFYKAGIIKK